jgi:hypothetical protein
MIYPEFENSDGQIITDTLCPVPEHGMARMWILDGERIAYHRHKITIGTRGYFMEGNKQVGECEVIELINLK